MNQIEENISALRSQRYSCSQATLIGTVRAFPESKCELSDASLKAISCGLRGGIGKTFDEGTCGALTGAVIAIGLLCPDDENKAADLSKELYLEFKNKFGTVCCGNITNENGKKLCNECCLTAGRIAGELLNKS